MDERCPHGFPAYHCLVGIRPPCAPVPVRRRSSRRVGERPDGVKHHRIYVEGVERTWDPEDKATDEAMNEVLDILLSRGRMFQAEIAEEVQARMGVLIGTARAYTSGSLLYLSQVGFVRHVETVKGKAIWDVAD